MHEAWERYIYLFRRCPMHGLPEWTQVFIFYNFVNTPTRMMLDASANGTLLDKPPREGLEILEKLLQNDYQHPTTRKGNMRRGTTQLDSSDTILAQIYALTNMVKSMQRQSNTQVVKVVDAFCELCGNNHNASECGQAPESSCFDGEYNKNIISNTYNPGWRKLPNFSWKNQNNTLNPKPSTQQGYQNQPRDENAEPGSRSQISGESSWAYIQTISTRSGKVLEPPTNNKQGEVTIANSKVGSDTDIPAQADISASVDKDYTHRLNLRKQRIQ
ncbi:hypothetical protein V6N13_097529 [Hibiscus sabdariffa]